VKLSSLVNIGLMAFAMLNGPFIAGLLMTCTHAIS
jgi:hypothetical protein